MIQNEIHHYTIIQIDDIAPLHQQHQICYSISFNYLGTKMASTCDNKIKIWEILNGRFEELVNLEGHQSHVTCLIFSNKQNSLISSDSLIRIWRNTNAFEWKSNESNQGHQSNITCMILNQKEDNLFTGSTDYTIKVWNLNLDYSILKELQILIRHQDSIYSLSLNQSEFTIASSGEDRQIIIWNLDNNNQWQFQQLVKQSIADFGCRLAFISEKKFIWVSSGEQDGACLSIFENIDGVFQENANYTISLQNTDDSSDYGGFPIIYNWAKNIMIVKHKYSIYILRLNLDGKLIVNQEIRFKDLAAYGTLSNDGKFLIFWSNFEKYYYIYFLDQK